MKIISLDGTEVGVISKHWAGFWREVLTDADFYGISFPVDLDVRMKAVLIGACILIVIRHFRDETLIHRMYTSITLIFVDFRMQCSLKITAFVDNAKDPNKQ